MVDAERVGSGYRRCPLTGAWPGENRSVCFTPILMASFADGSDGGDSVPDRPSALTLAETRQFVAQINARFPDRKPALVARERSVRQTRDTMSKFQGLHLFRAADQLAAGKGEVELIAETVAPVVANAVRGASLTPQSSAEPEPQMTSLASAG